MVYQKKNCCEQNGVAFYLRPILPPRADGGPFNEFHELEICWVLGIYILSIICSLTGPQWKCNITDITDKISANVFVLKGAKQSKISALGEGIAQR